MRPGLLLAGGSGAASHRPPRALPAAWPPWAVALPQGLRVEMCGCGRLSTRYDQTAVTPPLGSGDRSLETRRSCPRLLGRGTSWRNRPAPWGPCEGLPRGAEVWELCLGWSGVGTGAGTQGSEDCPSGIGVPGWSQASPPVPVSPGGPGSEQGPWGPQPGEPPHHAWPRPALKLPGGLSPRLCPVPSDRGRRDLPTCPAI